MLQGLFHALEQVVDGLPGYLHLVGDLRQGIVFAEIQFQTPLLLFRQQRPVHFVEAAEPDSVIEIIRCHRTTFSHTETYSTVVVYRTKNKLSSIFA